MMTKRVKNIAKNTKTDLTKNYQIVNSKATNQKYRICFEKCTFMKMEVFNNSAYEKSESNLVQEKSVDFKDLKNFWESKN